MKKSSETLKTVIIVLLALLTAALLAGIFVMTVVSEALLPGDILFELGRLWDTQESLLHNEKQMSAAAYPCMIVFLKSGGDIFFPINLQEYESALESTAQLFEEAVGSASNYVPVKAETYLESLLNYGILYYFDYPISIEILCAWGEGDYTGESVNVSRMVLQADTTSPQLIIVDENGNVFASDTQSDSVLVENMCKSYAGNGTVAAMIENINAAADTPILSGTTEMSTYSIAPSLYEADGELSREIMETFSVNPYLASVYRDGDAVVYMEGDRRLRLYADGHISFSDISQNDTALVQAYTDNDVLSAIEEARKIAFSVWGKVSFEKSRLSLSEIVLDEDGYTVYFEAYIGGVFVSRGNYAAAAVNIKNGKIAGMSLYPLRVHEETKTELMPFRLAQATAGPDSELRIYYKLQNGLLIPAITDMKGGR